MYPKLNLAATRRELISSALNWVQTGRKCALVTLVNIEGNSPYPVGTQMLVADNGDYLGQMTGGCAEQAIADHACEAIQRGENVLHRYGLDSPYFDIQLPCGSGVDVCIDTQISTSWLQETQSKLRSRQAVVSKFAALGQDFTKRYLPNQRLVLLGQGPILLHTSNMALAAGFDVLCVAQNTATHALLERYKLESMSLRDCVPLGEFCDEFTGLVSLFHEHDHEMEILAQALASNAFYIGALGSRRTQATRLESLSHQGFSARQLQRIAGPVGVAIEAKTPAQIAVSIVAQAVDELNKSINKSAEQ